MGWPQRPEEPNLWVLILVVVCLLLSVGFFALVELVRGWL